jgi:hypothetical protein
MRIRTILTAAAVPATLAAALLGTTGAASASVKPATVTWHTHQQGVLDTTNVSGNATDGSYAGGPVWAHDNMERTVTAVQDSADRTLWHVTVSSTGSFDGFANPIDGNAPVEGGHLTGSVKGTIEFDVTSKVGPSVPAPNSIDTNGQHSTSLALDLFSNDPAAYVSGYGPYDFRYNPIPVPVDAPAPGTYGSAITWGGGPNGMLYEQVG